MHYIVVLCVLAIVHCVRNGKNFAVNIISTKIHMITTQFNCWCSTILFSLVLCTSYNSMEKFYIVLVLHCHNAGLSQPNLWLWSVLYHLTPLSELFIFELQMARSSFSRFKPYLERSLGFCLLLCFRVYFLFMIYFGSMYITFKENL